MAQGRFAEADDLLEAALRRDPAERRLHLASAACAAASGDRIETRRRWARATDALPGDVALWRACVVDARREETAADATQTVDRALRRFPEDPFLLREAALLATVLGDHARAVPLWQRHARMAPFSARSAFAAVDGLTQLRRFEEAEAALRTLTWRFPLHPGGPIAKGKLAMAREDWDAAIKVWRWFRLFYPGNVHGWDQLGRAVAARDLARATEGEQRPVVVPRVYDEATRDLLLRFESLGDDCEFGMVQRRFGAEPLGLLRWNNVGLGNLLAALDAGLDGMGSPEHTELWFAGDGSETFIRDKRWDLHIHTFMPRSQVDPDVFFPKACRRVAYLREKFLADLRAEEKVFVFKSKDIWPEAMELLHAALRRFGKVRLLCVKPAGADHTVGCGRGGEAFEMADGLYVGFIGRMGNDKGRWNIAFDDWVAVCRAVLAPAPLRRWRPGE